MFMTTIHLLPTSMTVHFEFVTNPYDMQDSKTINKKNKENNV